jgi:glycosyltransferase involved in cell wall biosynthesis
MKVTYLGQVIITKGITELVTSCLRIQSIELILIGPVDSDYKESLKKIASERENGEWLIFTGELVREKALLYLHQADIFTLPSHREAFPFSILEAMALSKPIIAADVGAISEILDINGREQCGLCFPSKDSEKFKLILTELINNNHMRNQMGLYARKRVEKLYSSKKVFPLILEHWNNLIC